MAILSKDEICDALCVDDEDEWVKVGNGIAHKSAEVSAYTEVGEYAKIDKKSFIDKNVEIERYCSIGSRVKIYKNAMIMDSSIIYNGATIGESVIIPPYTIIDAGEVINRNPITICGLYNLNEAGTGKVALYEGIFTFKEIYNMLLKDIAKKFNPAILSLWGSIVGSTMIIEAIQKEYPINQAINIK